MHYITFDIILKTEKVGKTEEKKFDPSVCFD